MASRGIMTPLLNFDGLSFGYGEKIILQNLSLASENRTTIFKGPSGCGKTTLLKLLAGDLKPSSCSTMPPTDSSCLIIQEDSLFPWLTGRQNIVKIARLEPAQIQAHPMYSLVSQFIDRKAYQMSYGQRRLVELFRAVLFAPRYLYMDEPFNFLDPHRIIAVVPFLRKEMLPDTTLTISTHHRDDDLDFEGCVYSFDGNLPVQNLTRER